MRRAVWHAFWSSRLFVQLVGMAAVVQIGVASGGNGFDPQRLTQPFGYFGNLVFAPLARWDSVWYLKIARSGYAADPNRMTFFPLYPDLIRVLGWVVRSQLVAAVLISMVAFAIALMLLYRLICLDFSEDVAEVAVLLIAFSPVSLFFSAVYTESLFLALSLGCIYQARRGRWLWAGILGGLAAAARNGGVLLIVPTLLLLLYGPRDDGERWRTGWSRETLTGWRLLLPRYRVPTVAVALLLIPLGLIVYLEYLRIRYGMGSAPFKAEADWYHKSTWPFGGAWQGIVAAWDGLRQLIHGPPPPVYFTANGGNAMTGSVQNLTLFGFLVAGAVAFFGGLRRLPIAYSAYTLVSLALPLSDPVTPQPLASLSRYQLVIFPLFIWGADVLVRRRWTAMAIGVCAVLLGYFTVQFATWRFVA